MNYSMSYKHCIYLFICNELYCIDQGDQLLIITNTMNIITILLSSNFNVFLNGYSLQCIPIYTVYKYIQMSRPG